MSAKEDAAGWAETVQAVGAKRDLRYDAVGGLNPPGGRLRSARAARTA